ncbi:hypothetical protein DAPPUDRAFT_246341 [Daphnia pulex]|uniref:Peptidase S1 domain-containing protein n=1 Tax=Daphnia pulex TaxID=6669 RepID=E9GQ87_DAPPU|nr:hypothetical protein DAPPUDRAFT_246341 [Daphnia pulex]|eukprot:EFX78386.1 hypothetical protein DAPPUDRAFT_246341 [Daphnia pulex]
MERMEGRWLESAQVMHKKAAALDLERLQSSNKKEKPSSQVNHNYRPIAGVGYAPSYHGKTLQGQIVNPEFVPLPSFNPHPGMAYRQQHQDPNGWSYSFGHPSPIALEDASSSRQGGATTTTTTTTPAPAIKCGQGPSALPKQSLMSERVAGSGSTEAKANAWPFLVILKKYVPVADYEDDGGGYFCSGSLISDTKVLLAANCLEKMSVYEMSRFSVLVGVASPVVQMTRRISKVVLHSKFNAATYANDIAIITLDAPVVISRTVGPVCLAPADEGLDQYADQSAVILGWGLQAFAVTGTELKQGTVAISFNVDCKADTNFGKYVTSSNICISATDKFVCADDVGGPVVVLSSPGIWTQIGINSYTPNYS